MSYEKLNQIDHRARHFRRCHRCRHLRSCSRAEAIRNLTINIDTLPDEDEDVEELTEDIEAEDAEIVEEEPVAEEAAE